MLSSDSANEALRSKARRRAGFRLEKRYPGVARELRHKYDTPSYRSRWGKSYYARRTEQVRKDLAERYQPVYDKLLQEEMNNERNWPSSHKRR
jgi:hypothetical protein